MLKSSKRIFSLVLCFSILFSVFAGMNISVGYAYTDSQGHWAESIINKWSDSGIISGDGNGEFRPDDYITRAEFVKVVVTAKQYVDLEYNKYTDVNENDWFYPVICMASAAGIINGYEDGSFAPNNFITREEASVVMGRAYDLNLTELNDQFLDSYSISSWARPYISAMSNNGIITGYEDGTFKPLNPISRAETIQILDRIDSFSKNNKNSNDIVVINPNNGPSNSSGGKVNGGGSGGSSGGGSSNIKDNYFKVIFNLNYEASMGTPHSQKVKKGEYVSEPDTPKRDGFSFIGWFKDANCTDKFDFSLEPVNSNLTLYAGWGKDGYYSITDITVDKNNLIANVEVSAQEDCNIALKVLTEDKKSILGNGYAAVQEGTEVSEVSVNITMQSSLPQYFVVAADLIDNSGQYLCNSFVCITYTQAYEEFLAKDINDFDGKTVLNFDEDDDMNFAVLNDEVKVIDSETSNTIDESKTNVENGIFVLNNTDNITRNLKDGDKVLIDYGIGYFVTVKDVSNKGDSIIIESDDDYTLSDYCDYIKVDMDVNADSSDIDMSEASDGITLMEDSSEAEVAADIIDVDDELSKSIGFNLSYGSEHIKLDGSVKGKITVSIKMNYDVHLFSENYFYCKATVKADMTAQASLQLKYEDNEENDTVYDWATLGDITFPFGITGLSASVKLTIPFDWEVKAGGIATAKVSYETGFTFSTTDGYHPISKKEYDLNVKMEGSARVALGPKIAFSVEFLKDVLKLSIEAHGGVELKATATTPLGELTNGKIHTCKLCVDGKADKFINISLKLTYKITEMLSGTPLNLTLAEYRDHLADFYISLINDSGEIKFGLGECPFKFSSDPGILTGYVADAEDRTAFVSDAKVVLKDGSGAVVESLVTDSEGKYSVELPGGNYVINVSAAGYIPFDCNTTVVSNETKYVETLLMVDGDESSFNNINGTITNSVNGSSISGVKIEAYRGWNKTSGNIVSTAVSDDSGRYGMSLNLGNYTLKLSKQGYVTNTINITVTSGNLFPKDGSLVPENSEEISEGELRIVLRWGQHPYDLDSHLVGPTVDGQDKFHTYYSNKSYYYNGIRFADLDLDDTSSYGPETTTIYIQNDSGTYSFYVHDYSNKYDEASTAMSNSGAYVEVYSAGNLAAKYDIPTNRIGTLWKVFEYDSMTRKIKPVNIISNQSDSGNVGLESIDDSEDHYDEETEMVLKDIYANEK